METLEIALEANPIKNDLILHSYQGSQYASKGFIAFCVDNDITQSMSRAVNPYYNA